MIINVTPANRENNRCCLARVPWKVKRRQALLSLIRGRVQCSSLPRLSALLHSPPRIQFVDYLTHWFWELRIVRISESDPFNTLISLTAWSQDQVGEDNPNPKPKCFGKWLALNISPKHDSSFASPWICGLPCQTSRRWYLCSPDLWLVQVSTTCRPGFHMPSWTQSGATCCCIFPLKCDSSNVFPQLHTLSQDRNTERKIEYDMQRHKSSITQTSVLPQRV